MILPFNPICVLLKLFSLCRLSEKKNRAEEQSRHFVPSFSLINLFLSFFLFYISFSSISFSFFWEMKIVDLTPHCVIRSSVSFEKGAGAISNRTNTNKARSTCCCSVYFISLPWCCRHCCCCCCWVMVKTRGLEDRQQPPCLKHRRVIGVHRAAWVHSPNKSRASVATAAVFYATHDASSVP